MDSFVAWLQTTALSQAIVSNTWVWPACESLHFIGLALVIGVVGFFDLRLIGLFRRIPVRAAHELMPFALLGFGVNLMTGLVFLIGHPEQYVHNIAWWYKVGSLAVAGLNAGVFELAGVGALTAPLGAGDDTPLAAKAIGAVSIMAWFAVLYWGRVLPFVGNAY
jgi:hypothetical protein